MEASSFNHPNPSFTMEKTNADKRRRNRRRAKNAGLPPEKTLSAAAITRLTTIHKDFAERSVLRDNTRKDGLPALFMTTKYDDRWEEILIEGVALDPNLPLAREVQTQKSGRDQRVDIVINTINGTVKIRSRDFVDARAGARGSSSHGQPGFVTVRGLEAFAKKADKNERLLDLGASSKRCNVGESALELDDVIRRVVKRALLGAEYVDSENNVFKYIDYYTSMNEFFWRELNDPFFYTSPVAQVVIFAVMSAMVTRHYACDVFLLQSMVTTVKAYTSLSPCEFASMDMRSGRNVLLDGREYMPGEVLPNFGNAVVAVDPLVFSGGSTAGRRDVTVNAYEDILFEIEPLPLTADILEDLEPISLDPDPEPQYDITATMNYDNAQPVYPSDTSAPETNPGNDDFASRHVVFDQPYSNNATKITYETYEVHSLSYVVSIREHIQVPLSRFVDDLMIKYTSVSMWQKNRVVDRMCFDVMIACKLLMDAGLVFDPVSIESEEPDFCVHTVDFDGNLSRGDFVSDAAFTAVKVGGRVYNCPQSVVGVKLSSKNVKFRPRAIINGNIDMITNADALSTSQSKTRDGKDGSFLCYVNTDMMVKKIEYKTNYFHPWARDINEINASTKKIYPEHREEKNEVACDEELTFSPPPLKRMCTPSERTRARVTEVTQSQQQPGQTTQGFVSSGYHVSSGVRNAAWDTFNKNGPHTITNAMWLVPIIYMMLSLRNYQYNIDALFEFGQDAMDAITNQYSNQNILLFPIMPKLPDKYPEAGMSGSEYNEAPETATWEELCWSKYRQWLSNHKWSAGPRQGTEVDIRNIHKDGALPVLVLNMRFSMLYTKKNMHRLVSFLERNHPGVLAQMLELAVAQSKKLSYSRFIETLTRTPEMWQTRDWRLLYASMDWGFCLVDENANALLSVDDRKALLNGVKEMLKSKLRNNRRWVPSMMVSSEYWVNVHRKSVDSRGYAKKNGYKKITSKLPNTSLVWENIRSIPGLYTKFSGDKPAKGKAKDEPSSRRHVDSWLYGIMSHSALQGYKNSRYSLNPAIELLFGRVAFGDVVPQLYDESAVVKTDQKKSRLSAIDEAMDSRGLRHLCDRYVRYTEEFLGHVKPNPKAEGDKRASDRKFYIMDIFSPFYSWSGSHSPALVGEYDADQFAPVTVLCQDEAFFKMMLYPPSKLEDFKKIHEIKPPTQASVEQTIPYNAWEKS